MIIPPFNQVLLDDKKLKCIGNCTIDGNHGAFCGHSLGKPHGMMEYWKAGYDTALIPTLLY